MGKTSKMAKVYNKIINICTNTIESTRATDIPNPITRYKTSTGNMAFNGLRYDEKADGISWYMDETIVPYFRATNDPWISPKWHGKQNPNEGWWDKYCERKVQQIRENIKAEFD